MEMLLSSAITTGYNFSLTTDVPLLDLDLDFFFLPDDAFLSLRAALSLFSLIDALYVEILSPDSGCEYLLFVINDLTGS